MTAPRSASIDLYWIPLGFGGSGLVRFNGRVYERIAAWRQGRPTLRLLHTALRVEVPDGTFVVETMWPMPDGRVEGRGVTVTAPVFFRPLGRWRLFRYEVRRWRDGVLPDADAALGGPHRVSASNEAARRLLDLVGAVPPLVWGRDERRTGEMWNSNSVIAWLLTSAGIEMETVRPPTGTRAPGWDAGVAVGRDGDRPSNGSA